ncbi:uncharacterized protein LOC133523266 [Cydia pomonella]|uniref:uncharacterized protein LOC133523266 n=1 Tax=Cydia pomonella TaxID=82600 RepID=UPI002ADE661A|nr:uncharacterized protein LOC133523266 [Cydia pomonella]XP_061714742.1 uncharacterized protein LOC133523266 [Cydia pomonella]
MNSNIELPQVHTFIHLPAARNTRSRRDSRRHMPSEAPPAYSSLYAPTNNIDETASRYASEDEARLLINDNFEDKTAYIGFIQKVLAVKLLQMFIINAIMVGFLANRIDIIRFMDRENNLVIIMVMSYLVFMLIFGVMFACQKLRPRSPYRYIFLVAYPLSLSVFISAWTIFWHLLAPIILVCIYYCVVFFVLLLYSIFALQTKLQFVPKYSIIIAIGTQIVMYAVTVPFIDINAVHVLCPTIIMIFEYIYILYNLKAMTSLSYWSIITPADFVNGAINLHFDYFNILSKPFTAQEE